MPSDNAFDGVGAAFSAATEVFRSAVIDAVEQVRAYVESHADPGQAPAPRVAAELGMFAAPHIDADRFAALFREQDTLDADTLWLLERTLATLRDQSDRTEAAVHTVIARGGDVTAEIDAELASVGRAFGAARIAELVRSGRIEEARKADPAAPFPFARWTAAERRLAPPLVARLTGADLDAGALAGFMDGTQKIVLLVDAPAPAAALARLITPGTFVMQTTDAAGLARLAGFDGPGIAALVPDDCATFVHDPGAPADSRLVVESRPDARPRPLRRSSAFQQTEALALLDLLAEAMAPPVSHTPAMPADPPGPGPLTDELPPAVAVPAASAPVAPEPADTLAAWLLAQAGLTAASGSAEH